MQQRRFRRGGRLLFACGPATWITLWAMLLAVRTCPLPIRLNPASPCQRANILQAAASRGGMSQSEIHGARAPALPIDANPRGLHPRVRATLKQRAPLVLFLKVL